MTLGNRGRKRGDAYVDSLQPFTTEKPQARTALICGETEDIGQQGVVTLAGLSGFWSEAGEGSKLCEN